MASRTLSLEIGPRVFQLSLPSDLEDADYVARDGGDAKPYWGFLWASAVSLAGAIMSGPDLTGKRVIELGAGLGLSSMAAAARGAQVIASDIRPEAVRLLAENATANGVRVETRVVDFYAPPPDLGSFDGVLAADVIYNDGMLGGVVRFMRSHLTPSGLGFLADPYRIMPAGVQGAARLGGFEVTAVPLPSAGTPVVLYTLARRRGSILAGPEPDAEATTIEPSASASTATGRARARAPKKTARKPARR